MMTDETGFRRELAQLINRHSAESGSNTPDFILAAFLLACLKAWDSGVLMRDAWYGDVRRAGDDGREALEREIRKAGG